MAVIKGWPLCGCVLNPVCCMVSTGICKQLWDWAKSGRITDWSPERVSLCGVNIGIRLYIHNVCHRSEFTILHHTWLVCQLVGALSPVDHKGSHQGYKLHSISKLFISQVMIPQVMFVVLFSLFIFHRLSTQEPASSRVTYFILRLHRNQCQLQPTQEKIRRGFGTNAGEWTGMAEISQEEIPGSKHSMYGYILTYSRL